MGAVALLLLFAFLGLVVAAAVTLFRKRQQRYEQPVEHIRQATGNTWQALHREALDRPRRVASRHQNPDAPAARQSRAKTSKRRT